MELNPGGRIQRWTKVCAWTRYWDPLLLNHTIVLYRFLAYVDLLGTTYSASTLATGYGAYIAQPLLRKAVEGNEDVLTEDQAVKILEDSLKVLYYRDARSLNKVCPQYADDYSSDISL